MTIFVSIKVLGGGLHAAVVEEGEGGAWWWPADDGFDGDESDDEDDDIEEEEDPEQLLDYEYFDLFLWPVYVYKYIFYNCHLIINYHPNPVPLHCTSYPRTPPPWAPA